MPQSWNLFGFLSEGIRLPLAERRFRQRCYCSVPVFDGRFYSGLQGCWQAALLYPKIG